MPWLAVTAISRARRGQASFSPGYPTMSPEPDQRAGDSAVHRHSRLNRARRRNSANNDRWRALLEKAQRNMVRRRASGDGSAGARSRQLGDGFLATFDGPGRAIRCAFRNPRGRRLPLGVDVRTGVHAGECEIMGDGHNRRYGGEHRRALVAAQAAAGEVLVSSAVRGPRRWLGHRVRRPRYPHEAQGPRRAAPALRRAERSHGRRPLESMPWLASR